MAFGCRTSRYETQLNVEGACRILSSINDFFFFFFNYTQTRWMTSLQLLPVENIDIIFANMSSALSLRL